MTNEQLKAVVMALLCPNGINIIYGDLALENLAENAQLIMTKAGVIIV